MPNNCFVPGCTSNYTASVRREGTVPTFSFPKDEDLRQRWITAVARTDRQPSKSSVVCIKHFRDGEVIKTTKKVQPNGRVVDRPMERTQMVKGSVPSIFPGASLREPTPPPLSRLTSPSESPPRVAELQDEINMEIDVCRICLQSAQCVRLIRRDLSTFYAACVMSSDTERETSVWVCAYCWTRASQCLHFIQLARRTELLLTTDSFDVKPKEFHPYTVARLSDMIICETTECIIPSGIYYFTAQKNIVPSKPDTNSEVIPKPVETLVNESKHIDLQVSPDVLVKDEENDSVGDNEQSLGVCEDEIIENEAQKIETTIVKKPSSADKLFHKVAAEVIANETCGFELVRLTLEEQREEVEKKKKGETYRYSKYKCICGSAYRAKSDYIKHLKFRHDETVVNICGICYWRFPCDRNLAIHLSVMHELRWRCVQCHALVLKNNMKWHRNNCSKEYKCEICHRIFKSIRMLNRHWCYVSARNQQQYTCDYCGMNINGKSKLIKHIRAHTAETQYECVPCNSKFADARKYKYHMKTTHCDVTSGPAKSVDGPPYCVKCKRFYKNQMSFDVHLANSTNHIGEDAYKYSCGTCPMRFKEAKCLKIHIKRVHLKIRDFPCPQCDKAYSDRTALKCHMRLHHSESGHQRSYMCDACGLSYKGLRLLKEHKAAVHEKRRPYACDTCDATFGFRSAQYLHIRYKHRGFKQPIRKRIKKPATSALKT